MSDFTTSAMLEQTLLRDELTNQTNRECTLFTALRKVKGNGSTINLGIESEGATATQYDEGDDVAAATADVQASAIYKYGLVESSFTVTDLARSAAAVNGVPGQSNQLASKVRIASAAVCKLINSQGFSGTATGATNRVIGLETMIDDTATLGTIAPGSASYWKGTVIGEGETAVAPTKKLLYNDVAEVMSACGIRPHVALCHPMLFARIQALFDEQVRYVSDYTQLAKSGGMGTGTLPVISINGCQLVEDVDGYYDADSGLAYMYYVNYDHCHWEMLPDAEAVESLALLNDLQLIPAYAGTESFDPILDGAFAVKEVGRSAHAKKAVVSAQVQLVTDRRNSHGIRKNYSVTA